ncbi:MAG: 16S rRNA (adenine(1518)-N(6)/adenine(1519)-N(6))-dimethyltransferase, partial [Oscillospiraceae bacterium]|nr:16S rRNA (adenine(1518)-N(6)/adenine(1519)-N(6))-dimethyltransferase [Oscillospiraceae bacterium]
DSAVIRIDVEKKYSLAPEDEKFFFSVVKAAFSQRRKTLANSLSSMLSVSKQSIYDTLQECGFGENTRVEQLDMESLILFSCTLRKNIC